MNIAYVYSSYVIDTDKYFFVKMSSIDELKKSGTRNWTWEFPDQIFIASTKHPFDFNDSHYIPCMILQDEDRLLYCQRPAKPIVSYEGPYKSCSKIEGKVVLVKPVNWNDYLYEIGEFEREHNRELSQEEDHNH